MARRARSVCLCSARRFWPAASVLFTRWAVGLAPLVLPLVLSRRPLCVCRHSWLMANTLATTAAILRLGFGVPKYLLWGGLAVVLHFLRPHYVLIDGDGKSVALRAGILVVLTGAIAAIGAKKIAKYKVAAKKA